MTRRLLMLTVGILRAVRAGLLAWEWSVFIQAQRRRQ